MLAKEIHISKSQISERLGGKVPDQEFVRALIRATIPEPRLRARRLAEALRHLEAATHPAAVAALPPAATSTEVAGLRAQQVETYERLTRALEQQNQLHAAASNSAKLVMVLLTMISKLEQRIANLTGERDQLRAAHIDTEALQRTQQQLARAQEQEQRAQQELLRAQEKQREAEELALMVQLQVDQLTDELDRLRGTTTSETAAQAIPAGTSTESALIADPDGDDIEQALDRIAAVNDQGNQLLQRITQDLRAEPSTGGVVRDNPPDNSQSGAITVDNLAALQIAAQADPQPHGREEVESQQVAALPVRSRIASGVMNTGLAVVGFSVVTSIAAAGPVVLMSGAWAFWFGIPWGEVRHQPGKSFAITLFIAACLILSCALMATPGLLARGEDGGLAFGCLVSVPGVVGSCVLLSNYPAVMEWLPKAVGAY
ncbi:hypothetical protein AB0G81_05890 [Streptomyces asoensis]|uniref:hypothetical protein n=1 Tax=Streptomyces asoensis TaxID=249586 RepID=UPI0033C9768A